MARAAAPRRPEDFLELVQRAKRGRLKLYVGSAAGVGKTYRMLEEAHALRKRGVDVVVGVVETHGRAETAALLPGLEEVPRRQIAYRGVSIEEMDLDAILARRPDVVIIDEVAHTNAPGSRNAKRYQDVFEILGAGINVICAVNIQHLESLNDIIQRVTTVKVRETVPDWFVRSADEIVLVDATTGALSITQGTVAGNKVKFDSPAAQLTSPKYQDMNGVQMLQAGMVYVPGVNGNDEVTISVQ